MSINGITRRATNFPGPVTVPKSTVASAPSPDPAAQNAPLVRSPGAAPTPPCADTIEALQLLHLRKRQEGAGRVGVCAGDRRARTQRRAERPGASRREGRKLARLCVCSSVRITGVTLMVFGGICSIQAASAVQPRRRPGAREARVPPGGSRASVPEHVP